MRLGAHLLHHLFQHMQRLRADNQIFFSKDQRGHAGHAVLARNLLVNHYLAQIFFIRQNIRDICIQTHLLKQRLLHVNIAHISRVHPIRVECGLMEFIAFALRGCKFFQLMEGTRVDTERSLIDFNAVLFFDTRGKDRTIGFDARHVFGRNGRRAGGTQFKRVPIQLNRMCFIEPLETQAGNKTPRSDKVRPNVNANRLFHIYSP